MGWFLHQNPFEFDINHFEYNASALKFWGGSPSVASYIIAANSIAYFAALGINKVRAHNFEMITLIHQHLSEFVVSPTLSNECSETIILNFNGSGMLCYKRLIKLKLVLMLANMEYEYRLMCITPLTKYTCLF